MAGVKGRSGKGNGKQKLSPKVQEQTRALIDTTTIVNKLFSHIKGENKMEATQIRAADILLKKTLPDLSAIEQSIDQDSVDALKEVMSFVKNTSRGLPGDSEQAFGPLVETKQSLPH